jgi:hypothetical protein
MAELSLYFSFVYLIYLTCILLLFWNDNAKIVYGCVGTFVYATFIAAVYMVYGNLLEQILGTLLVSALFITIVLKFKIDN